MSEILPGHKVIFACFDKLKLKKKSTKIDVEHCTIFEFCKISQYFLFLSQK